MLGQPSTNEVLHHRGFSRKWAAKLQYKVAEFAHKMGQAKKIQVCMNSVLAKYKQNRDDGELEPIQKKQRTADQHTSQEHVKTMAPSDSKQTHQPMVMMGKLEGTLLKTTSSKT